MKISYGITVHNESDELNKLLNILTLNIDEQDEIIEHLGDQMDKNIDKSSECVNKIGGLLN